MKPSKADSANPKTFIIAEAGVNHNGSLSTAKKLVEKAAWAGADAVKFQTFKAENIICPSAPKAEYQRHTTPEKETQFEMIKRLELDTKSHEALLDHCRKHHIKFLSSPFDLESIQLLKDLGLDSIKIPSGEITNLPYLRKIGSLKKRLFLSTGMSNPDEIQDAITVLTESGTTKKNITILHCTTEYPTPFCEVNLRAIPTMISLFRGMKIGYSDHTPGIEVAIAATAMGACVIEKHFTLDRTMEGPDHKASLEPDELKWMIQSIRNIDEAMGDENKKPSPSEVKNIQIVRKSIVASCNIPKGELFSVNNITVKRPGTGISPMKWDFIVGKTAKRNYRADELIEFNDTDIT